MPWQGRYPSSRRWMLPRMNAFQRRNIDASAALDVASWQNKCCGRQTNEADFTILPHPLAYDASEHVMKLPAKPNTHTSGSTSGTISSRRREAVAGWSSGCSSGGTSTRTRTRWLVPVWYGSTKTIAAANQTYDTPTKSGFDK